MLHSHKEILALNLNTYSYYSLLDSALSIDDIINFALKNNQKFVAISDDNLHGCLEFYYKAIKNNLKPIIGLDVKFQNYNFLVYAKNFEGYKNLIKISSELLTTSKYDLINSYLNNVFIVDKKNNFDLITNCKVYNLNQIACNEARYLDKENQKVFEIVKKIKNKENADLIDFEKFDLNFKLLDANETFNRFNSNQIDNLNNEIKEINIVINKLKPSIIEFKNNENISSKPYLKKLCIDNLNSKILNKRIYPENKKNYLDRIEYELKIIDEMGFNDYFLIVQDFVMYAKNNNILVGPGRGSAAGSLVAFLLNITEIDPIKYGLLFERFLNPGRVSMPDIDIDIMDSKRDDVINYIFDKYGYDRVCHIVTFSKMKAKTSIRDVGRILKIDIKEINLICKNISVEDETDLIKALKNNEFLKQFYEKNEINKVLIDISNKLIGFPRQIGIHAAGIVLSKQKLNEVIPIRFNENGQTISQFSMEYLEDLGLIKIDLLGLINLTTIYKIIKTIELRHKKKIDLFDIDLEDELVFKDVINGKTLGIFQLESNGMTSTIKKIKPKSISEISICSALFRPGPSKQIDTFAKRKNDNLKIEYIDEKNKEILFETYGILVYQEQVINLVKKIANFSPFEADTFRKLIAKKHSNELESFKKLFFENALKNGYTKKQLDKIYDYIYKFADYGFNKSHSISYALISYWMLYFKHYYPLEFMAILIISLNGSTDKILDYINECNRLNISVCCPDILKSNVIVSINENKILLGFNSIKGIATEKAKKIVEIRNSNSKNFNNAKNIINLLTKNGIGQSYIEALIYSGAFENVYKNKKNLLNNLDKMIISTKNNENNLFNNDFLSKNELENELTEQDKEEFNKKQKEFLGFSFLNQNKIVNFDLKKINNLEKISSIENSKNEVFLTVVVFLNFSFKKTKNNNEMLSFDLIDFENKKYKGLSFNKNVFLKIKQINLDDQFLVLLEKSKYGLKLIDIKNKF